MKKVKEIVYFIFFITNIVSFLDCNNTTVTNQLIGYIFQKFV
jgi:hypothetical protein